MLKITLKKEDPAAVKLQFFEKLFDYVNYLKARKDRIWSVSWKIQNADTSTK